jgi:aspartate aminotransferase
MQLANRTQLIKAPSTSRMRTIANELKESGVQVINFAAGELDVDTSDAVKDAARRAIGAGRNIYTPTMGLPGLRKLVAAEVSRCSGAPYSHEEVGLTAGAKQALFNAATVLLNPGDEVIVPAPYWVTFPTQVELAGARPVFLDTRPRGYRLLCDDVARATTGRTRAVIINSPNNPTGTIYAREELAKIAQLAAERDLWIIFDECYASLLREGHSHANIVRLDPRAKDRTVLVNSFSKSHALTGWRLGYVAAPAPVIKAMENLQGHTTSNPNSIAQYAVQAALEAGGSAFIDRVNQVLQQRLAAALDIVGQMPGVSTAPAEGAFYLFLNVESKIGKHFKGEVIGSVDQLCELALSVANVAVVSGSAFGDPSGMRISYAIGTKDVVEGLNRLRKLFAEIQ